MKLSCIVLLMLLLPFTGFSQNLIPNGGFEDENICTEYQKNCAPEAWIATSLYANYYFNDEHAHQGSHFAGLTVGSTRAQGMRNFLRTQLLCALRKDHQYKLSFYVFSKHYILDSIGIYFSSTDFLYEKGHFKSINPQLWSINGIDSSKLSKPREWQKVELLYTATGQESFITIGSFKRNDYKGITVGDYRNDYYFFLDDVVLQPADEHEVICPQADSVRQTIYADNVRHNYLEKRTYYMRHRPPQTVTLPVTRMPVKQKIDTLVIPDIFFATASYQLSPRSFNVLDSFVDKLKQQSFIDSIVIEGHTDSVGKLAYNIDLSQNRARAVKEYFTARTSMATDMIITRGFAYLRPVASNKMPADRQRNRRVEIFLYRHEE
jgi:outer membrane protein OmpA-like peptidoglycan-associated protein